MHYDCTAAACHVRFMLLVLVVIVLSPLGFYLVSNSLKTMGDNHLWWLMWIAMAIIVFAIDTGVLLFGIFSFTS